MSSSSEQPDRSANAPGADEPFDPYYKWLGISPDEQPPTHYRLLGLKPFETDLDVIDNAADRQMAHLKRFSGGRRAELSQRVLNEVSAARACLLDAQAKLAYDKQLRAQMPSKKEAASAPAGRRSAWPDGKAPKTLDEFLNCLAASRLYTREQLEEFIASLPADRRPNEPAVMAKELVQAKKLTKYQAAAIYQGRPFHLLFGQYEVMERVGVGGMGQVYKAHHRQMDRVAAVKVLSSKSQKLERSVERFRREVRMAAQLSHANIVTTYDADEVDGEQYLVMEYVEGRDVAAILKQNGPFPVDEAIDITIQAARGLEYTHGKGITHRDVKPGNLMQARDGTVKLSDLGLARLNEDPTGTGESEDAAKLTMPGQIIGTVDYMSPEQAVDTHAADARSDIYGLGCTMYRLLTGELPYPAQTKMQKLLAHRSAPVPSVRAKRPEVSAAIDDVFQKMVAKEPADRFQTATELIEALENAKRGGPPMPVKRPEPRPGAAAVPAEPSSGAASDAGPLPVSAPAAGPPPAAAPAPRQPVTPPAVLAAGGAPASDLPAQHPAPSSTPQPQVATGEDTISQQLGSLSGSAMHDRVAGHKRKKSGGSGTNPVVLVAVGVAIGVILLLVVLVIVLIVMLGSRPDGPSTPPPEPEYHDTARLESEGFDSFQLPDGRSVPDELPGVYRTDVGRLDEWPGGHGHFTRLRC